MPGQVAPAAPGTVVLFGDIACPWATLAVEHLHAARGRLGDEASGVRFDLRAFPLEVVNERPTPKPTLDEEMRELGGELPEAAPRWHAWQRADSEWPVTTLLALEAVEAAKAQGLAASEALDLRLRRALFVESRCVSILSVVLDCAAGCADAGLDVDRLRRDLEGGAARGRVLHGYEEMGAALRGSPHLFLPDGSDVHNPAGEVARYEDVLRRAARSLVAA